MTDAEIAGYMGWRGPGAYTQHTLRKIREIVGEAQRREREACALLLENYAVQYDAPVWAFKISEAIRARGDK